jgi:hypothetical protein
MMGKNLNAIERDIEEEKTSRKKSSTVLNKTI